MIYCFSGTGNSLQIAHRLADLLGEYVERIDEKTTATLPTNNNEAMGLIFPVYAWGLPQAVSNFLKRLPEGKAAHTPYIYGVLTCGDDIGRTDRILRKALAEKKLELAAVYSLQMRNTYVCLPGFDVDSSQVEQAKLRKALIEVEQIAQHITRRQPSTSADLHPGSWPDFKSYVLRPLFTKFLTGDVKFSTSPQKCTHCGICIKACPMHNLKANSDGTPQWLGHCTMCLACYHACPQQAISYGLFTRGKGQVKVNRN